MWRENGYEISLMTGISWGGYGSYYGSGDAFKKQEVQTTKSGRLFMHGNSVDVGYNVPTPSYIEYIKDYLRPALDFGVRGVFLEEPEYWAETGWSEAFKSEWQRFYGVPWQEPDSSPDAQYRASKLKYELYFNALKGVFEFVDEEATKKGIQIECHVPTHSLINYAQWRIVSPESHLIDIPQLDGYIAQVWTGTARSQNEYKGLLKERTFETAYLEYGQMFGMVQPTGKKVWFLTDPVEDNPDRSWADYKKNYEATVVASLMWPQVHRFEVMPWPSRIFKGSYPLTDLDSKDKRGGIPAEYAAEILTICNALNDMNQTQVNVEAGSGGIGVVVSDTMMFQRANPNSSDARLGGFFGLAMPLVKAGIPLGLMQLENSLQPGALSPYKLLVLTYEHQKPLRPAYHDAIVDWVRKGGLLLFIDDASDPYNHVREWWNNFGESNRIPQDDLFQRLQLPNTDAIDNQAIGSGIVRVLKVRPSLLARDATGHQTVLNGVRELLEAAGQPLNTQHYLRVNRGPYAIIAVMDEAQSADPLTVQGRYVDLFSPDLPLLRDPVFHPGSTALLMDLDWQARNQPSPKVLAASARIRNTSTRASQFSFSATGPFGTKAVLCVALPKAPAQVTVGGLIVHTWRWDDENQLLRLSFMNNAETVQIDIVL
ncbi:MAG: hypothetical protein AMXMBFR84_12820 [Candidatus Hydrogenedentota bacterium]